MTVELAKSPEFAPVVCRAIEGFLASRSEPTIFEFGSGASTAWLASLTTRTVQAVEHDPDYAILAAKAASAGAGANVQIRPRLDMATAIRGLGCFDLVLVDCFADSRAPAIRAAVEYGAVKPDGWLVVDDAERAEIRFEIDTGLRLNGWIETRVRGSYDRPSDGSRRSFWTSILTREFSGNG